MSKVNLADIESGYLANLKLNQNNAAIEAGFDNTLSRNGASPNAMGAQLDMGSNRIINCGAPSGPTDVLRLMDLVDITLGDTFVADTTVGPLVSAHLVNIPSYVSWVRTSGYYVAGDGGAAQYIRVASQPSHAGKFQGLDGGWWELAEREVYAEMLGARPYNESSPTDTTLEIKAALDIGRTVVLPNTYYINSNFFPAAFKVTSQTGGGFKFGTSGKILLDAVPVHSEGVSYTGTLTSAQYSLAVTGAQIVTAFGTPTYQNNSGDFAGGDFTHTLTGNSLTIGLGALTGDQIRSVTSDFITLDPTKRYVVDQLGSALTTQGAFQGVYFQLYDSGGTYLSDYTPQSGASWSSFITGASKLKICVSLRRDADTVTGLSSVIDLSKLQFFALLNEASTVSATPVAQTHLQLGNCIEPVFRDNTFSCSKGNVCSFANCTNVTFTGNKINQSWYGVNVTTCSGVNYISNNDISIKQLVDDGTFLNMKFVRSNCVGGASNTNLVITGNNLEGAAWGIEHAPAIGFTTEVLSNNIKAEYLGVSVNNGLNATVTNNVITIDSGFAYTGIELAGAHIGNDTNGNSIYINNPLVAYSFGIAVVGGSQSRGSVSNNDIIAPVGIFGTVLTSTDQIINNNRISWMALGVHVNVPASVTHNVLLKKGSMRAAATRLGDASAPNAAITYWTTSTVRGQVDYNHIDAGDTYSINSTGVTLTIVGNIIKHEQAATYSVRFGDITNATVRVHNNRFAGGLPTNFFKVGTVTGDISYNDNYSRLVPVPVGNHQEVGSAAQTKVDVTATTTFVTTTTVPPGLSELVVWVNAGSNANSAVAVFHVTAIHSTSDILDTQQIGTTVVSGGPLMPTATLTASAPDVDRLVTITLGGVGGGSTTMSFYITCRLMGSSNT